VNANAGNCASVLENPSRSLGLQLSVVWVDELFWERS
jgi:hypothetical protein